jgi:hypothetical protein
MTPSSDPFHVCRFRLPQWEDSDGRSLARCPSGPHPGDFTGPLHGALTHQIIGAAMTVLNTLRPGLDEKIYERALSIELRKPGHTMYPQQRFPVYYDGQRIGILIADLIVDNLVIVDTKIPLN